MMMMRWQAVIRWIQDAVDYKVTGGPADEVWFDVECLYQNFRVLENSQRYERWFFDICFLFLFVFLFSL